MLIFTRPSDSWKLAKYAHSWKLIVNFLKSDVFYILIMANGVSFIVILASPKNNIHKGCESLLIDETIPIERDYKTTNMKIFISKWFWRHVTHYPHECNKCTSGKKGALPHESGLDYFSARKKSFFLIIWQWLSEIPPPRSPNRKRKDRQQTDRGCQNKRRAIARNEKYWLRWGGLLMSTGQ